LLQKYSFNLTPGADFVAVVYVCSAVISYNMAVSCVLLPVTVNFHVCALQLMRWCEGNSSIF